MEPHIVVVGSTMIDMITYSKKIPDPGETVVGESFSIGFGGKGANQATMARRLRVKVSMVNTIGDDVFGDTIIQNFESQGINTEFVIRVTGSSGVAPIWVEPDGTNRIICVPGANNAMTSEQARAAIGELSHISVVIGQLEIPQEVTAAAFAAARNLGITTILNPAPFAAISAELLANCDWIIPNETEFSSMNPKGFGPTTDEIIGELATTFNCRFAVTLGSAGAAFSTPGGKIIRLSAPKVQAVDTTGAGDAFVGAFAVGLALGLDDGRAIQLGIDCASESVTRLGAQSSYPSEAHAREILKAVKEKK